MRYAQLRAFHYVATMALFLTQPAISDQVRKLEAAAGCVLVASIQAEGREAVREIVAAGNGIGFVSTAEFGQDERLHPINLPRPAPLMQESLICIKARRERRLIKAFMRLEGGFSAAKQDM